MKRCSCSKFSGKVSRSGLGMGIALTSFARRARLSSSNRMTPTGIGEKRSCAQFRAASFSSNHMAHARFVVVVL